MSFVTDISAGMNMMDVYSIEVVDRNTQEVYGNYYLEAFDRDDAVRRGQEKADLRNYTGSADPYVYDVYLYRRG